MVPVEIAKPETGYLYGFDAKLCLGWRILVKNRIPAGSKEHTKDFFKEPADSDEWTFRWPDGHKAVIKGFVAVKSETVEQQEPEAKEEEEEDNKNNEEGKEETQKHCHHGPVKRCYHVSAVDAANAGVMIKAVSKFMRLNWY